MGRSEVSGEVSVRYPRQISLAEKPFQKEVSSQKVRYRQIERGYGSMDARLRLDGCEITARWMRDYCSMGARLRPPFSENPVGKL